MQAIKQCWNYLLIEAKLASYSVVKGNQYMSTGKQFICFPMNMIIALISVFYNLQSYKINEKTNNEMHKSLWIQIIWKGAIGSTQHSIEHAIFFCFFLFPNSHKIKFRFQFNKTTKHNILYMLNKIIHISPYSILCI